MKKILIGFFLNLFILLFISFHIVSAQIDVPGVSCGVPGDANGASKCCTTQTIQCANSFITDIVTKLPFVGEYAQNMARSCEQLNQFQKKFGNLQCIFGDATTNNGNCVCVDQSLNPVNVPEIANMCKRYLGTSDPKSHELENCLKCSSSNGFWTAIGCMPLTIPATIQFIFSLGIGFAGVVALLCIIYSAVMMQASGGNPERIKKTQENLTSCIIGLILIIFSVFILKLIGIDILKIPFL